MAAGVTGHHGNPALLHVDMGTEFAPGVVPIHRPNGMVKAVLEQMCPPATALFKNVKVSLKLIHLISLT